MPKEILLYGSIYSYSAADLINQIEAAKSFDIRMRVNTPGGEVLSLYGVIAKWKEHPKGKAIAVDGRADSAGAYLLCYADDAECLDISTFTFHRAAYPDYIESNPAYFNDAMKADVVLTNKHLRAGMEGKFTAEDWLKVTGTSLDDLFSLDSRIDVTIDAKQAKKLGLVKKIVSITPEKKAEIESHVMAIAAHYIPKEAANPAPPSPTPPTPPQKIKTMTLAELQAQHPELIQAVIAAERDRVGAYLAFIAVDAEAVVKGIKEGATLSQTAMAEFSMKALSNQKLAGIKADGAPPVVTGEQTEQPTADAKKLEEFNAAVAGHLKQYGS